MNPSPHSEADALRSDIDVTRRRMDDTMDALGERFQPRHLLDEALGFIRGNTADGESRMTHYREKLTHSCENAMHSVVNTVKQNPVPALLIGAGVGWLLYESMRDKRPVGADGNYYGLDREGDELKYDPEYHYDRPLDYPTGLAGAEAEWQGAPGKDESKLGHLKDKLGEKASAATESVKEKLAHAGEVAREKAGAFRERAGEKLHAARERASQMTARLRDGTHHAYVRTRERVVDTADQHPIEVGFAALAAGLLVGLALPTPSAVDRMIGPTADRLRERTRDAGSDMLQKGRRVAQAAMNAVKDEARSQGLTPERLRTAATSAAERAKEAGGEAAQREGLMPEANPSGAQASDPSGARPAV